MLDQQLFNTLIFVWMGIAVIVVPFAIRIRAPYGRHSRTDWGPMIDNRLGWILMEVPALIVVLYFFFTGSNEKSEVLLAFIALWIIHYGYRSLIFPFILRTKGKKMPVAIMSSAIFFNLINGFFIGYYLGNYASYEDEWLASPFFIIGVLIFLFGLTINWTSDWKLINLRKPGETGYKIPKGGMFNRISCPNHFGEIVEWTGFAIMTFALPMLSFAVWTMANLIPRALNHHDWYKEKFDDYPSERKAVLPFIL